MNAASPRMTGLPVAPAKPVPPTEEAYAAAFHRLRQREGWSKSAKALSLAHNNLGKAVSRRVCLAYVEANPGATTHEVTDGVGLENSTVGRALHHLWMNGNLRRERKKGSCQFRYWIREEGE